MGLKAQCAQQQSRAVHVRSGSIATGAVSTEVPACLLHSENGPSMRGSEMTLRATTGREPLQPPAPSSPAPSTSALQHSSIALVFIGSDSAENSTSELSLLHPNRDRLTASIHVGEVPGRRCAATGDRSAGPTPTLLAADLCVNVSDPLRHRDEQPAEDEAAADSEQKRCHVFVLRFWTSCRSVCRHKIADDLL